MSTISCEDQLAQFQQFRQDLYVNFPFNRDSLMDLVDAITGNITAQTPVELCEHPSFRRGYSALYKAIRQFFVPSSSNTAVAERKQLQKSLLRAISRLIKAPNTRNFYLFGLDTTPIPRPFSPTLPDRTYIHQPNTINGNKPINIGHQYSLLSFLPEAEGTQNIPWSIPLSSQRVRSNTSSIAVGVEQIDTTLHDCPAFEPEQLSVLVADSYYSQRQFLDALSEEPNLVLITRVRSNRVFYCQPSISQEATSGRGHRRWYGERFDLKDETTWHQPDEITQTNFTTRRGRPLRLNISAWHQMLMRGTKEYSMHKHPFTLLQVRVTDEKSQQLWHPMWLIVLGQRRNELSIMDCYLSYRQRFDMEHTLRFSKQRLLMNSFQTPDVEHEENWMQLTQLAYIQLWAARKLVKVLPRPKRKILSQKDSSFCNT
ncbi:transposase [Aerosakkonemataceae cyanobacterium BLCC-F50]|uniref:Transposase n=1 Tax=Floridaenema flaviceps BLCC-F50 TaxID=3153642 RepID=A0ABV4XTB5_9CYAN